MSREHLISQSTFRNVPEFEQGVIKAYGMPWNEHGITELKYSAIASKILCQKHNSMLSNLDNEAGKVAKVFRSVEKHLVEAKNATSKITKEYNFSGLLFEKWLLKTFINFRALWNQSEQPPIELVEIVFGDRDFPNEVGLAIVGRRLIGMNEFGQDMKYVEIINTTTGGIEYVLFQYFGMNYLLPLTDQPMPKDLMSLRHQQSGHSPIDELVGNIQGATVHYHVRQLNYQFGNNVCVNVKIDW